MIGYPERVKTQRSSIPKLGRFIAALRSYRSKTLKTVNFGQKRQNFCLKWQTICHNQNFPGIQSMIFSEKTIRTTSIPKIRKIHSGVWKLQAQNSKTGLKWTKFRYSMAKNLPYLQNATLDFHETQPKVAGYCLSSYGIGLYAGKILGLEIIP